MTAFHFFQRTVINLDAVLGTYVHDVAGSVIGAISGVATTLLAIYVVLWGWTMLRGMISEPLTDGITRMVRLTVIVALAINLGRYEAYISNGLFAMPDALAAVVAGTPAGSSASFLDTLLGQIYDFGEQFHQAAVANSTLGIPDLTLLLMAGLIWLVGVCLTAYGAFLLVLAKIGLTVVLAIGPIFVLMLIFDGTKRFFDVWLGQVLNFILMVTLTAATLRLILTILIAYLTDAAPVVDGLPGPTQAIPAIAIGAIGLLVLLQVQSLASALAGGVAVSSLGAVGWAYGRAKGGMVAMRPTALRRSMNTLRSDARIAGGVLSGGVGGRAASALASAAGPAARGVGYAAGRGAAAPMAVYRKITTRKNSISKA